MARPLRILHAPADVGGHAYGLSRAERELGLESDVAVFAAGPFGYGFDINLQAGVDRPVWVRLARRAAFLRRAARAYDVFHFNFGQTLLSVRQLSVSFDEIALLKRLGKTVLVTYQGCDVRPKAECPCRRPSCFADDRYRQPAAARVLRHADQVFYLNPDLRRWLPGAQFLPYASVDVHAIAPRPLVPGEQFVVAHAPTDRNVKGTRHVIEAVEALSVGGLKLKLDLIEGVPRANVLERLARADVVVDQLVLGWYGGLAVEAMALGRPVLGKICEDEPEDNPYGSELPIVRTSPSTLQDDLRSLAAEPERQRKLSEQGRRFVEEHHDPRRVARTILDRIGARSRPVPEV